ncbi:histone-lysine N-methyltransferase PRDM9-like [Girardinichthys multiradiatus]|uniref:histone-lysine N-methyltransferase PRDM9-like n=1 Tax=Girardinichthys multiradiatus TaxID=208333 RepID=UPI001FAD2FC5|nr:histone-lysine N-methyltransferase PRDM9-like [Girardinichthys multiradiatus]
MFIVGSEPSELDRYHSKMTDLQLLRTLVTERLTAAAEKILVLVQKVLLEQQHELLRRGEAEASELCTIKQEVKDEKLEEHLQDEAVPAGEDTMEIKNEQLMINLEALKVELKKEDVQPSTSCELSESPPILKEDSSSGSISCRVCGMVFSYHGSLRNHAEIHADDEHCICGVCGELQVDKQMLLQHLETHLKIHICKFCGKTFRRRLDLDVHARSHTGEKPFVCRICGKCFSRKSNVEIHMRTHTGDKPHRREVCGKCFNTSSMIRHLRTHSGEKPFSCHVCHKAFTASSDMKIHMRKHTGERPYRCPICGESFTLSTPLKTPHEASHGEAAILLRPLRQSLQRCLLTAASHEDA